MSAIIKIVWAVIGPTVVEMALSFGLPKAMEWLLKKGLPKWIVDGLVKIIKEALEKISEVKESLELSPEEKRQKVKFLKREAKAKAKYHCSGVACTSETKGLG